MRRRVRPILEEEGEEPLLNLTPLIDVVFVLLITFMILAPLLKRDRIELSSSGILSKRASTSSLVVSIDREGRIQLQGKAVGLKDLAAFLSQEKLRHVGETPQLIADKNARFGLYQDVKNVFESCGFQELDILLEP